MEMAHSLCSPVMGRCGLAVQYHSDHGSLDCSLKNQQGSNRSNLGFLDTSSMGALKPTSINPQYITVLQDDAIECPENYYGDPYIVPSIGDVISILQECKQRRDLDQAYSTYAKICSFGLESQDAVGNHVIPMFVECQSLGFAQQVFNIIQHRNEHSWTSLISGHVQAGESQHALDIGLSMQSDNVHLSSYTLVALLKACILEQDICRAREIHIQIMYMGFEHEPSVGNSLISMYTACGSIPDAECVFYLLRCRDLVSWTALISGYVDHGLSNEAILVFEKMKAQGISPDAVTMSCIFKACGNVGAIDMGRKIHREMDQNGIKRDIIVDHSLIGMYAKCGALSEALEIFDGLPLRGVIPWNALISGIARLGNGKKALQYFQQMQSEGISPDAVTYATVLKFCGSIGSLHKGKEMHTNCVLKGLEVTSIVGNSLVDMYAKSGSLLDAQKTFEDLQFQDVVSWTALISGFAEHGPFEEATRFFELMQTSCVAPSAATYVCILKACANMECLDLAKEVHAVIVNTGLETDMSIGNSLISAYVISGQLQEAIEVFNNLPVRDVISWTLLIMGYTDHGYNEQALNCFKLMSEEGISPDPTFFTCALQACGMFGAIDDGQKLHNELVQTESINDLFIINSLIGMYVNFGLVDKAQEVFDKATVRDTVSWTMLVSGYVQFGFIQEALACFEQMQLENVLLDSASFTCILKACAMIGVPDKGQAVHMNIVKRGLNDDLAIENGLISMYFQCGLLKEAEEIFNSSLPDRVSWNTLIAGYVEHGLHDQALRSFVLMQMGGVSPDPITFASIFKVCIITGDMDKLNELYTTVTKMGFERDMIVCNALMSFHAMHGLLAEVENIFEKLPDQDLSSWYALIMGYAEHGHGQEALNCFQQMQQEGIYPDTATYASVIKACGSLGAIEKGQQIHIDITKKGFETDNSVGNSLVSMYAKCGLLPEAENIFEMLGEPDVAAWSSMVQGYGMSHQAHMAVQIYEAMCTEGVRPDKVTFTCLLMACSISGLVHEGYNYLKEMQSLGITPDVEQYTCIINLLAKAGHLYEAERFIEMLLPCETYWVTLLSACKVHGEVELGIRCFQQLMQFHREDAASYALLADIYASTGNLVDAYRIEALRKHAGATKKPGIAMIEVNKTLHEFTVGDHASNEMIEMFDSLSSRMKNNGYVPNLNLVLKPIKDEEKEAVLCGHAEKLAIAFGLLHLPEGQTLRVSKNLRMCNDCHEASKVISKIEKRQIILRDTSCIHNFIDGLCSCADAF